MVGELPFVSKRYMCAQEVMVGELKGLLWGVFDLEVGLVAQNIVHRGLTSASVTCECSR
jgi:hypothetical protein